MDAYNISIGMQGHNEIGLFDVYKISSCRSRLLCFVFVQVYFFSSIDYQKSMCVL